MKDKIIWILYNNCLYCSEVRDFIIGSPDKDHICIYLNPIIGDVDFMIVPRYQFTTEYCFNGWVYFRNDIGNTARTDAIICCNFDKICLRMNYKKEINYL